MTYEWYKPKPVTWEKWVTLLFYYADDMFQHMYGKKYREPYRKTTLSLYENKC